MKRLLFTSFLFFISLTNLAQAGYSINFQLVNEFGVPQPIESRLELAGGNLSSPVKGFGSITETNAYPGDRFFITRSFWPNKEGGVSPEGKGILYTVPSRPPREVSLNVNSITHEKKIKPITNTDRGVLGLINDTRTESGYNRVPRAKFLDELASIWSEQNIGGRPVHNKQLLWNYGVGGSTFAAFPLLAYSKSSIMNQLEDGCSGWEGESILCKELFLGNSIEGLGVSTNSQGVTWIFAYGGCQNLKNCQSLEDSGDSLLLNEILRPITPTKKDPQIKIIKVSKKNKRLKVTASILKTALGNSKLVVKQNKKRLVIKGKKRSQKIIFKASKKRLKKINLKKGAKIAILFKGRGIWKSVLIPID